MASGSQAGVVHVDVSVGPDELVVAWRPDSGRLLLSVHEPLEVGQRVAARVSLASRGVAATITGRVVSARRHGGGHRIDLTPDETRVRAVERLVEIARGERVAYEPRIPRFLATIPVVVEGPAANTYMNTFSVSEKGCGLAWSGPVPAVGTPIGVRLGAGNRAATFRSVVCWTARSGRTNTVGVRFVGGSLHAWAGMLAELKRGGAPPA